MHGEELIDRALSNPSDPTGSLSNELLREFKAGFPLLHLRRLLTPTNTDALRIGVFIASELGVRAAPLLKSIAGFINHPVPRIRTDVMDSILECATPRDGRILASAAMLIYDPHNGVRWKALNFLFRATTNQVQSAADYLSVAKSSSEIALGLCWLANSTQCDPRAIAASIISESATMRKMGVVAAARMARPDLLEAAATGPDEDVRSFASDVLRLDFRKP